MEKEKGKREKRKAVEGDDGRGWEEEEEERGGARQPGRRKVELAWMDGLGETQCQPAWGEGERGELGMAAALRPAWSQRAVLPSSNHRRRRHCWAQSPTHTRSHAHAEPPNNCSMRLTTLQQKKKKRRRQWQPKQLTTYTTLMCVFSITNESLWTDLSGQRGSLGKGVLAISGPHRWFGPGMSRLELAIRAHVASSRSAMRETGAAISSFNNAQAFKLGR